MIRVGLTGGIGAGKSAVSSMLASLGAVVIDSDRLAHAAVAPGSPGLSAIVDAFGPSVRAADGSLDRARMAEIVFADPASRARLEAIVHPRVRSEARRLEREAAQANPSVVVVHDVPLLVETGQAASFDVVVVVEAPEEVRLQRLTRNRGMSADEARARIAAQASSHARAAVADVVLDNAGDREALRAQVERWWADLPTRVSHRSSGPSDG